jgi:hypothetical protein
MRAVTVAALAAVSVLASADVAWSPSLRTAVVQARKSKHPLLVRVLSPFGVAASPYPRLDTPGIGTELSKFVLVRAASYEDLRSSVPAVPPIGNPGLVVLGPDGRPLKRFGGFVHDLDVLYVATRAEWRMKHEAQIRQMAAKSPKDPDAQGSLATLKAMSGDVGGANRLLGVHAKEMAPGIRAAAFEAVADECRMQGEIPGAIAGYRAALKSPPDPASTSRIRLHLAMCLLRNGDPKSAQAVTNKVLQAKPKGPLLDYAILVDRSVKRNGSSPPGPSRLAMPMLRPG